MADHAEDILNSLNGIRRAEAPAWLYAGIRAKLERQEELKPYRLDRRFALVVPVLAVLLALNIFLLSAAKLRPNSADAPSQNSIQAFAEETGLISKSLNP